jgi:preprotein translocase subunit SecF
MTGRPAELADAPEDAEAPVDDERAVPASRPASRRPEASGSGRVVPERKAPMRESGSAKRSQPSRQPRSKRGK